MIINDLDPKLLTQTRKQTQELHAKIDHILNNDEYHNRLLSLGDFEPGKAYQQKVNMTNFYGRDASVWGLTFSVAHSVDGSEDYLGVVYNPQDVVDGAWDAFQAEKAQKAAENKAKREAKKVEAKLRAQEVVASRMSA